MMFIEIPFIWYPTCLIFAHLVCWLTTPCTARTTSRRRPRRTLILGYITSVEHSCTIFLCSPDVRNIEKGGDPLYAVFFSTQGSGGYTWPKWVRFFAKNNCLGCEPEKKINSGEKKSFLWPGEAVFCDLRSFPKNKDRSPKIRILIFPPCRQHIRRGLPDIRIDPYF